MRAAILRRKKKRKCLVPRRRDTKGNFSAAKASKWGSAQSRKPQQARVRRHGCTCERPGAKGYENGSERETIQVIRKEEGGEKGESGGPR